MADPVWRYAEVVAIGLLLAYAVVSGLPALRWAVPAALAVLLLDAVRTMPADPNERYGWQVLKPGGDINALSGFESGLTACWAPLTAAAVLLVVWHRSAWRRRTAAAAAVAAVLVTGYAVVRIVDIWLTIGTDQRQYPTRTDSADAVTAVSLAVLPSLALGLTALALATALAGHHRRLGSAGAALLAVAALPHLDASIGAVPLPLYAGDRTALFAITPTLSMPQPVPALTALMELTAYLLLVTGLTGSCRPTGAAPAEPGRVVP
ncbi:hypothetical protein ONA91_25125 [Micromonospora sp. DR5-3]|uniref:hypothetical protein n=1 Tax=unclassified Micromonospora TaxID=2617518 RepID=UPI0016522867|nr:MULTISPECIES: hypothetical protein [unclassified Micromonospora]MCW3817740.1 hypothetical protein [Micromonospora sp. DR5-3]